MTGLSISPMRGVHVFMHVLLMLMLISAGESMAMERALHMSHCAAVTQEQRLAFLAAIREPLQKKTMEEDAPAVTQEDGESSAPFWRRLNENLADESPMLVTRLAQDDGTQEETAIVAVGPDLLFYMPRTKIVDLFHITIEEAQREQSDAGTAKPMYVRSPITALAPIDVAGNQMLLLGEANGQVRFFQPFQNYPKVGTVAGRVIEIVSDRDGKKLAVRYTPAQGGQYAAVACLKKATSKAPSDGSASGCQEGAWSPLQGLARADQESAMQGRGDVTRLFFDEAGFLHTKLSTGEQEIWQARITRRNTLKTECVQEMR